MLILGDIFLLYLSLILFLGSLFLYRKTKMNKINKTFFFLTILLQIFLLFFYFISLYFTKEGLGSIVIYYLEHGFSGANFLEYKWPILGMIAYIILGLFFCIWIVFSKNNGKINKKTYWISFLLILVSFIINPVLKDFSYLYNLIHEKNIKAAENNNHFDFDVRRIAHAGGGIAGKTYTNSFEAIEGNLKGGFSYFEIDFSFTKDNQLACIHDWDQNFKENFGFEIGDIPTLKEFEKLVDDNLKFHNCTIQSLAGFMEKYPEVYLITDVKDNNLEALNIIKKNIKDYKKRIIPQIYSPSNYSKVKAMGYEQIIWTLYRYNFSTNNFVEEVLNWIDKFEGSFAITMPKDYAKTKLPRELSKKKIPSYVHTVNEAKEKDYFLNQQLVSEIYTDFLPARD